MLLAVKVNTGLRTSVAPASEAPRTFYGAINPRVITTGCPAKRAASRQLPYRRPPATRASSSALPDELPGSPTAADAEAAPARAVLEVTLRSNDAPSRPCICACGGVCQW